MTRTLTDREQVVFDSFDRLMPLYRGTMAALTLQQRKIMVTLLEDSQSFYPPLGVARASKGKPFKAVMGLPVTTIALRSMLRPGTVSGHLQVLKEGKLVDCEFTGRQMRYWVTDPVLSVCHGLMTGNTEPLRLFLAEFQVEGASDGS